MGVMNPDGTIISSGELPEEVKICSYMLASDEDLITGDEPCSKLKADGMCAARIGKCNLTVYRKVVQDKKIG